MPLVVLYISVCSFSVFLRITASYYLFYLEAFRYFCLKNTISVTNKTDRHDMVFLTVA